MANGFLSNGTRVDHSTVVGPDAAGGQSFNGGTLYYVLPTPPGRFLEDVHRCRLVQCFQGPCPDQPCDLLRWPELEGKWLTAIWQGATTTPTFPRQCNAGSYAGGLSASDQTSPTCTDLCPAGRACFTPGTYVSNVSDLPAAPAGFYTYRGDLSARRCGVSYYSEGGAARCTPCGPQMTTRADNTTSAGGCKCAATLHYDDATGGCEPCPQGAACDDIGTEVATLNVRRGFWRPGNASADISQCPQRGLCAGGLASVARYDRFDDSTCARGRGLSGAFCLLCMHKESAFFDVTWQRCRECRDVSISWLLLFVVLILLAIPFGCVWASPRARGVAQLVRRAAARASLQVKLRITISFYQIVAKLGPTYMVKYPPAYEAVVDALRALNLSLARWIPALQPVCLGLQSLETSLWLLTLLPLAPVVAAPLYTRLCGRQRTAASAVGFIVVWLYLFFPFVAGHGFRVLRPCDCFEYADSGEVCFVREDCTCAAMPPLNPRGAAAVLTRVARSISRAQTRCTARRSLRAALHLLGPCAWPLGAR